MATQRIDEQVRLAKLVEVGREHAAAERRGDFEGTMATLEDPCVYYFYPVGLMLRGRPAVERYYRHFFAEYHKGGTGRAGRGLIREWLSDQSLPQQYELEHVGLDGKMKTFHIMGIWNFGKEKMTGETLWGNEEFLKLLLGPVWNELEPISGVPG